MPGVFHVPNTLGETVPEGGTAADLPSIRAIRELLAREGGDTFAALFAEPVQNSRGSLVPPPGYWRELRAICDEHGILLVADEVITGFGRLGEWFGSTIQGIVPDLLTFAKGSTSGYAPLGGVIIREPLARALWDSSAGGILLPRGHLGRSPGGDRGRGGKPPRAPRTRMSPGNVRALAPGYRAGLDAIRDAHPSIREVRGTGFFHTIEFTGDRDSGRTLTPKESADILTRVIPEAMRGAQLITRPDNRGGDDAGAGSAPGFRHGRPRTAPRQRRSGLRRCGRTAGLSPPEPRRCAGPRAPHPSPGR